MSHIEKSVYVDKALSFAQGLAFRYRHEFITPEHILSALFNQDPFVEAVEECFCHIPVMEEEVDEYLAQKMEQVPEDTNYELQFSVQSNLLFQNAYAFVESSNAEVLDIPHVVQAMLLLPESWACYFLKKHLKERIPDFIRTSWHFQKFHYLPERTVGESQSADRTGNGTGAYHRSAVPERQEQPTAHRRTRSGENSLGLRTGSPYRSRRGARASER